MPPESQTPRVTAGLTWQPEIGRIGYARASSTSPKASATPTTPDRSPPPLSPATAAPTARNTSNSVPTNSAISERTSVGDTADLRGAAAAPRAARRQQRCGSGHRLVPSGATRQRLRYPVVQRSAGWAEATAAATSERPSAASPATNRSGASDTAHG